MAKLDDAIEEIQHGLGYREDKRREIIAALQRAQRMLERGHSLAWWLRKTRTVVVADGTNSIELPNDFLRISRDYTPYYTNDEGGRVYLEETLPDDGYERWRENESEGLPEGGIHAYSIEGKDTGSVLTVFPIADGDYTITVTYYKKADELDDEVGTNEWLEHAFDLMVSHAGQFMASQLRNESAAAIFSARLQEARTVHFAEIALRDDDERPIEMGSRR